MAKRKKRVLLTIFQVLFLNHFKCGKSEEETCCNGVMGMIAKFVCAKEILDVHQQLEQSLLCCLTLTFVLASFLPLPVQIEPLTIIIITIIYGFHQDA